MVVNPVKQAQKSIQKADKAIEKAGKEISISSPQINKVTDKVQKATDKVNKVTNQVKQTTKDLNETKQKFDEIKKNYGYVDPTKPSEVVQLGKKITSLSPISGGTYQSNKKDIKKKIEQGWIVAYGQEITEMDLADGVVAVGISVLSSNPAPFIKWVTELVNESISELEKNITSDETINKVKNDMVNFAIAKLKLIIINKKVEEASKIFGDFGIKVGLASYSGKNKTNIFGGDKTISTTNAWQPYIGIKKLSK